MSLQRFEGPNLEEVLADVRSRWGDDAAIVEANRLRKGGIAGFFAKERFEVVVDVAPTDGDGESSEPSIWGAEATAAGDAPAAWEELSLALEESAELGLADRLLGMAESVSDTESRSSEPDFAAVLGSLSRQLREQVPSVPSPPEALPEPLGFVSPSRPARIVDRPEPTPATRPAPVVERSEVSAPAASQLPAGWEALLRLGFPEELLEAGRPAGLALPEGTADPARWLADLIRHVALPDQLPKGRGAVVAVVGDLQAALDLGRDLAGEIGVDAETLVLASAGYQGTAVPHHRCIDAVEFAAEQRRSWRRRERPTVVSVDAPCGRPADWARRVIDALEPTMVWAAVDAHRKPEDVLHWTAQLGGVDALSVTGLEETVSPAALLRCGVPVGRLEGRSASPALWAALLAPRLAAPGGNER